MRHQSIEFILVYEAFLVALQERCTTYHMTHSTSLVGESDKRDAEFFISTDRLAQTNIEIRLIR